MKCTKTESEKYLQLRTKNSYFHLRGVIILVIRSYSPLTSGLLGGIALCAFCLITIVYKQIGGAILGLKGIASPLRLVRWQHALNMKIVNVPMRSPVLFFKSMS